MQLKSMFNMQELRKKQQAIAVKYNRAEKAIKNLGLSDAANEKIGAVLGEEMKAELSKLLNPVEAAVASAPEGAAEMV